MMKWPVEIMINNYIEMSIWTLVKGGMFAELTEGMWLKVVCVCLYSL